MCGIQTVSSSAWHNGLSDFGRKFGAVNDEGFSVLGSSIALIPTTSSQPQSEDNANVCSGSPAMERRGDFDSGHTARGITMTTDAPLSGWGATMMSRAVNGTWDLSRSRAHIIVLEL